MITGTGILETQLDSLQWLRRCLEPQNEAIIKWKETASTRLSKLRSTEYRRKKSKQFIGEITEYFNEFRILRQPWGYILVNCSSKLYYIRIYYFIFILLEVNYIILFLKYYF